MLGDNSFYESKSEEDFSLIIEKNEKLEISWEYNSLNRSLIESLINEFNVSNNLLLHEEGGKYRCVFTITDDVEHSWCTGSSFYWELTLDEYIIIENSNEYHSSHKYRVHKFPDDYAREMLLSDNYFTEKIIPQDVEVFLESLEKSLKEEDFGFYSDYNENRFENYQECDEWLSNESDNYYIDETHLIINLRKMGANNTEYNEILLYNDEGILEQQMIYYNNQIIINMEMIDYDIYEIEPDYPEWCKILLTIFITTLCISIVVIIALFIKRSIKNLKNKRKFNDQCVTSLRKENNNRENKILKSKCSICNTTLAEGALFCHICGVSTNSKVKLCKYCGVSKLYFGDFCHNCGNLF